MPISQAISINYFKILLYDYTLALLVICHIAFVLIPQPWNSHQQPVFCNVWHISSFRVTLFDTEFMSLSYTKTCIKIAYILYYSQKFVPHPFLGANFSSQHDFLWRLTSPSSTLSPFSSSNIGQYIWLKPLSMPITILIFARFLRNFTCACMKEWRIFIDKISQAYIVLAYEKAFITELFK